MQHVQSSSTLKRSFGRGVLAVALGLFAFSCTDSGPTTTSVDRTLPTQDPLFGYNGAGNCMDDDNNAFGSGGPINCTSNDISIAETFVTSVNGATFTPGDVLLCTPGETINLGITLRLEESAQSSRQDVGVWVSNDKDSDAHFGSCNHYTIDVGAPGAVNEADPDEQDACAGIAAQSFFDFPLTGPAIPALCPTTGSQIVLGGCVAWNVPSDDAKIFCPDPTPNVADPSNGFREASLPTNAAKCNCTPFTIDVVLAGQITITKNAIPNHAQDFSYTTSGGGMSNFTLDDDAGAPGADATWQVSRNFTNLNPNTGDPRVVTETVPAGWVITNIACTGATNSTVTISGSGGGGAGFDAGDNSVSIDLASGEHVQCTFDNTAQASLDIEKQTLGGTASFDFTATGTGLSNFSRNTGTTNPTTTAAITLNGANMAGDKFIQEVALAGWTLTNITCTADGATIVIGSGGSGAFAQGTTTGFDAGDNTVKVTLAPGSDPSCTFVNTKNASVDIEKVSVGGTGTFDFVESGPCISGNFSRTTTTAGVATTTAESACIPPFADQFVQETVPSGWQLTNITCTAGGATVVIGSGGSGAFVQGATTGFDAGDNTVKITPAAGSATSCLFENTRTATLTIQKSSVGGTGTFDFLGTGAGVGNFSRNTGTANPTTDAAIPISVANFGTKFVQETVPAGWTLTNITCTANGAVIVIGRGGSGAFVNGGSAGFEAGDNTVQVAIDAGDTPTCTFENTRNGSIDIEKISIGDVGTFNFVETGPCISGNFSRTTTTAGVSTATAATECLPPFPFDQYVQETVPTGWALTNISCSGTATIVIGRGGSGAFVNGGSAGFEAGDNTVKITEAAGQTASCTFTNTELALVRVIKTVNTAAITGSETFTFTLRTGASAGASGSVLETLVANSTNGGTLNFTTFLTPGTSYQICEIVLPGWSSSISGLAGAFTILLEPDGDNSTICVPFTPTPGELVVLNIDNTPPPGGDARTIGFWKNWSSCTGGKQDHILDQTLASFVGGGVLIGDLFVNTCAEAFAILNKSDLSGKKQASDPAYNMAAQLLAAKLNIQAGAGTCAAANTAIADGQALLDAINFNGTGSYKNAAGISGANAIAATLDSYNNNTLCP